MVSLWRFSRWAGSLRGPAPGLPPPPVSAALLPMLALRFAGHVPYFKFGSVLILPHGLSFAGAAVTALAYSVLCVGVARWLTRRQAAAVVHRPAAAALLGTMVVIATMMTLGPLIGLVFPGSLSAAEQQALTHASRWQAMLPAYLGLLIPVCGSFFAAQFISRARAARPD